MAARKLHLTLTIMFLTVLLAIGHAVVASADEQSSGKEASAEVVQSGGQSSETAACSQVLELLQQQKSLLTRELAQLKRELALLRESIARPGLKEIFSGIGYILGLAGIGFFVHCRKQQKKAEPGARLGE